MARPVADYLVEIGPFTDIAPPLAATLPDTEIAPIWREEPEENPQIAIDAAREEGRAEGLAAAQADFAAELAQARESFEAELEDARQKWANEEAERLREQLAAGLVAMEERLADGVARVLRPFILAALRRRMTEKLVENVRTIVGSADKIVIKIAGPEDLVAALREELQAVPAAIEYAVQDGLDVSVIAETTSIETQLRAWTDLIGAGE
ncbi:MAG: hypothetical protein P4L68_01665 [Methylovirgula sp.]|nr:hypothetical protein [Methylovirgula sp.]